ncbi:nuclear receptor coactivator protein neosin isoform X2 [Lycorma delicatula]|uniref:nuclear receptor coactivator protein neosin isoform X2 n=1 Tax=Lycorma delicatula TaxID=130591 RepID=UPI003F514A71
MGDNSPETLKIIRDPSTIKSRIFIGNMPPSGVEKKNIEDIFAKYGKIVAISMNRGFAFVQFDNENSAVDAIKNEAGRILQNKKLDIKPALTGKGGRKSPDWSSGRERSPLDDKRGGSMDRDRDRERPRGGGRSGRGGRDKNWRDVDSGPYGDKLGVMPHDYPPPANIAQVDRTNDCEIIVVNKIITEYAEYIERRLKKLGLTVDLLFPNEDVPLGRVLANISGRGSLYAIVVTLQNEEHRSLTVNILHGQHQEHRNMPMDDAISLIMRNFELYLRGERAGVPGLPLGSSIDRHPEAIQTLLNLLQQNRQLTVLQYDKVIRYLQDKREVQIKIEVGDSKEIPSIQDTTIPPTKQAELQNRILNILNKTGSNNPEPTPAPAPVPAPTQWSGGGGGGGGTAPPVQGGTAVGGPPPLLNDPTVQKALDNLIQGDLLRKFNSGAPTPVPAPQPLFGAYGPGRKY